MSSLRASALLEANRGVGVAGRKPAPTLTGEHVQECARQEQRPNAPRAHDPVGFVHPSPRRADGAASARFGLNLNQSIKSPARGAGAGREIPSYAMPELRN